MWKPVVRYDTRDVFDQYGMNATDLKASQKI